VRTFYINGSRNDLANEVDPFEGVAGNSMIAELQL
jgi:hypothetical protein